MRLLEKLRKDWLLAVLFVLWVVLVWQNYTPGTWLIGWDSLHPEFDFALNIQRGLDGVWQGNWGLGAATGMGMIADLPQQIVLWLAALFLPVNALRYAYHFAMLLLGPMGAYFLLKKTLQKDQNRGETSAFVDLAAFLGAVFYLLNLGALQNFYAPYEAFTTQYGFLPWLFWAVLRVLANFNGCNLAILALLSLLSTPMAVTPTVWLVWLGALIVLLGAPKARNCKTSLTILAVVVAANLFWLLPFAHYALTNASTVTNSKISRMSSEESYLLNRKYGRLSDVALLRGFWFGNVDRQTDGSYEYMFLPWRQYLAKPEVLAVGYGLFAVLIVGLLAVLGGWGEVRLKYRGGFLALFTISVLALLNSNPPLGFVFEFLRQNWPLFREVMRFPYTKFSVLGILTYSVFFALGTAALFNFVRRFISQGAIWGMRIIGGIAILAMVYFMLPAFQGNLIYSQLRLKVPTDYFQLMKYLKTQSAHQRVLPLPMHTFWSWRYHDWGYRGSGFLWQGIKQPILDRAFDVWSPYNQTAYQQFSEALWTQDWPAFEKLLGKYQIDFILWDQSLVSAEKNTAPQTLLIKSFLAGSSQIKKKQTFGKLTLYQVYLKKDPPLTVGVSAQLKYQGQTKENLIFGFEPGASAQPRFLQRQVFDQSKQPLWVKVWVRQNKQDKKLHFKLRPLLPQIYLGKEKLGPALEDLYLTIDKAPPSNQFYLNLDNNSPWVIQSLTSDYQYLGPALLDLSPPCQASTPDGCNSHYLRLFFGQARTSLSLTEDFAAQEIQNCGPVQEGQSYSKRVGVGELELEARDTRACLYLQLAGLPVQESLLKFSLKYRSESPAAPSYCLLEPQTQKCLNFSQARDEARRTDDWTFFKDWALLPGKKDLWPHLYWDVRGHLKSERVNLRNIKLTAYPLFFQKQFDIDGLLQNQATAADMGLKLAPARLDKLQVRWPQLSLGPNQAHGWLKFDENSPEKKARNCDSFNQGLVSRRIVPANKSDYAVEYQALDATACEEFVFPGLSHKQGYLLTIKHRRLKGLPLDICLTKSSAADCYLRAKLDTRSQAAAATTTFQIPPFYDSGRGYSLVVNNPSIGRVSTTNQLLSIKFTPLAYSWLKNVSLTQRAAPADPDSILLLNQAYDPGWLALAIDAKPRSVKILPHLLINDWANGWELPAQNPRVVIFYGPKLLEWLGFLALAVLACGLTAGTIGIKIPLRK